MKFTKIYSLVKLELSYGHHLIITDINISLKPNINVYKRNYSRFNKDKFLKSIESLNLNDHIPNQLTTNEKYNYFHDKFLEVIDIHAPITKLSKRKRKQDRKPWITSGIRKAIHTQNKYYGQFMRSKDVGHYQKYKFYRNKVHHLIKISKKKYYLHFFIRFRTNMKKIWQGIKDISNLSPSKTNNYCLQEGVNLITNPFQIANKFNIYFNKLASNLVSKMNVSSKSHKHYLETCVLDSFFLNPTTEREIQTLINQLDSNKSPGIYNFPVKLIKLANTYIANPLTLIINDSFQNGHFPDRLKIPKIIPLFKGGSKLSITNYRPISLLPIFSKIIEQLMLSRLKSFLERNQIIFEHQYGFQKKKSTTLAVLDLLHNITESFEKKEFCAVVFLDFAKAFDTVNHDILVDKLESYGIRGVAKNWFKSYLTNSEQLVSINDTLSSKLPVKCGVPQGSVLGPILFLLYINDIANSYNSRSKCFLFADDTSLFSSAKNIHELETTLNEDLCNIQEWLLCNKLSLNVSKSNCVIFCTRQKNLTKSLTLKINNEIIQEKSYTKYLGVI